MNILVTNDDGISSELLAILVRISSEFGRVYVSAPARQCSAMSHHLTIHSAIAVEKCQIPFAADSWSVSGSPADCVKLALESLLPCKPDIVFSGINKGFNSGFDIAYSGTVGAAKESLLNGIPSVAFSVGSFHEPSVVSETIGAFLPQIIREVLEMPAPRNALWNVNIPDIPVSCIQGIKKDVSIAPTSLYHNTYSLISDSGTNSIFQHSSYRITSEDAPADSDVYYLLNGWITIGKVTTEVLQP